MPHECRPRCPQCPRTPQHAPPSPCTPLAHGTPRRPLAARTPACNTQPGLRPPCVLSPDPVTTPGCPVLGGCVRGGDSRYGPGMHARHPPPPCVFSPDPVTTPGHPVPGGCVRGGRQAALPRRRRAATTVSTRTPSALPCCRDDPVARPGARAGRIAPPQPASHPAPRRRRADTRTDAVLHTRAGRRATWTAHGDYLLVLSSTHTSCQRHSRARVVSHTAFGDNIGHRPPSVC